MKKAPIILASASPRRKMILGLLQLPVAIAPSGVDEPLYGGGPPADFARELARLKALAVAQTINSGLVVGADTVVVIDDQILEKPRDEQQAQQMLHSLSGQWHQVMTGVCVIRSETDEQRSGVEVTRVKFAPLRPDEVSWYVSSGEPADKAGAYAIQGWGSLFVERIEGDYLNVVGLPLRLVCHLARELGVDLKDYVGQVEEERRP